MAIITPPGDWDEQVREPMLVPPRDQGHDDRTRHVRARKRAAARRQLMNEIEEEVAGERRAQALRQVVRAVH